MSTQAKERTDISTSGPKGKHAANQGAPRAVESHDVSLFRVIRAEWLKFWTLPSSYWIIAVTLVTMVGFALLMAFGQVFLIDEMGEAGNLTPEAASELAVQSIVASYGIGQIVVAVLGVMVATSEYATGQIRSTLAAVPTRIPVLVAKIVVTAIISFVVGALAVGLSWLVTLPILSGSDIALDLSIDGTWRSLLGVPLYFSAIALFGLGLGFLIRHTAGAISLVLGILLVLPILGMIPFDWMNTIATYLPNAGERIITGFNDDLTPWQGFAVLGAYVVAALTAAGILLRTRDA